MFAHGCIRRREEEEDRAPQIGLPRVGRGSDTRGGLGMVLSGVTALA